MGATAFVASVLAQLQKLFDIQVPGFQISTHGTLALAPLIHGDRSVVNYLEERHDALGFAIGTLDMSPECAHRRPVIAKAARPF